MGAQMQISLCGQLSTKRVAPTMYCTRLLHVTRDVLVIFRDADDAAACAFADGTASWALADGAAALQRWFCA